MRKIYRRLKVTYFYRSKRRAKKEGFLRFIFEPLLYPKIWAFWGHKMDPVWDPKLAQIGPFWPPLTSILIRGVKDDPFWTPLAQFGVPPTSFMEGGSKSGQNGHFWKKGTKKALFLTKIVKIGKVGSSGLKKNPVRSTQNAKKGVPKSAFLSHFGAFSLLLVCLNRLAPL